METWGLRMLCPDLGSAKGEGIGQAEWASPGDI